MVFEEAGTSLLGPLALNCASPDEGNMAMLERIASPEQRERFLVPLARGDLRSCFAMTEPAPGAGSDPSALRTAPTRSDGGWVIEGDKHWITGAGGAGFAIVMAPTGEAITYRRGATMFLVDTKNSGWHLTRVLDSIDRVAVGGHAAIAYTMEREAFGSRLTDLGMVQKIDRRLGHRPTAGRMLIWQVAWLSTPARTRSASRR